MPSGEDLFVDGSGQPQLTLCAVLYVDLLGVSALAEGQAAQQSLVRLERALRSMYRDFLADDSPWPAAMFSDTLVVAAPLVPSAGKGAAEIATGGLTIQAAWLQLNLVLSGFFLRGGLALGQFHIREGLLFGEALVEAYRLESRLAVHPRVVFGSAAAEAQREALKFYSEPRNSPQNALLLVDQDGTVFIDYLELLFDEPDDPRPGLEEHRDAVAAQLTTHRNDSRIWDKYRWVADYHNAVCERRLPSEQYLRVDTSGTDRRFDALVP